MHVFEVSGLATDNKRYEILARLFWDGALGVGFLLLEHFCHLASSEVLDESCI